MKQSVSARVTVKLDVLVGSWGDDCRMSQIVSQARESALEKVCRAVEKEDGVSIVGSPSVTAILATEDQTD